MRSRSLVTALLLVAGPVAAQTPFSDSSARAIVAALADDSMQGRLPGTPGARAAALYLAGQLARLGLTPAGDSGTFLQRVPLERTAISDSSRLVLSSAGRRVVFPWGRAFAALIGPPTERTGVATIWGDPYDADSARATFAASAGKFVLILVPPDRGLLLQPFPAGSEPAGVIAIFDSGRFRGRASRIVAAPGGLHPVGTPRPGAGPFVVAIVDRDSLEQAFGPLTPGPAGSAAPFAVDLSLRERSSPLDAWNVVAARPGADPVLRRESVALTAHYDHLGRAGVPGARCVAVGADSVCNGADDDASGAAAVLLAAEAAAHAPALRRSQLFVWHTAEEEGLLGARWLVDHPPALAGRIAAAINLDAVGRNAPDSLFRAGTPRGASPLLAVVDSVNPGEPRPFRWDDRYDSPKDPTACRFDQAAYARAGVPTLWFTSGPHPEYHRPTDEVALVDFEKVARVARLAHDLAVALGDTPTPLPPEPTADCR
jgi:Zn-dependent M28 family amino/carboxypeptidase